MNKDITSLKILKRKRGQNYYTLKKKILNFTHPHNDCKLNSPLLRSREKENITKSIIYNSDFIKKNQSSHIFINCFSFLVTISNYIRLINFESYMGKATFTRIKEILVDQYIDRKAIEKTLNRKINSNEELSSIVEIKVVLPLNDKNLSLSINEATLEKVFGDSQVKYLDIELFIPQFV